jgi:hypothetical protein
MQYADPIEPVLWREAAIFVILSVLPSIPIYASHAFWEMGDLGMWILPIPPILVGVISVLTLHWVSCFFLVPFMAVLSYFAQSPHIEPGWELLILYYCAVLGVIGVVLGALIRGLIPMIKKWKK